MFLAFYPNIYLLFTRQKDGHLAFVHLVFPLIFFMCSYVNAYNHYCHHTRNTT